MITIKLFRFASVVVHSLLLLMLLLAIFGISFLFLILSFHFYVNAPSDKTIPPIQEIPVLIVGFGFGASFVAMFA